MERADMIAEFEAVGKLLQLKEVNDVLNGIDATASRWQIVGISTELAAVCLKKRPKEMRKLMCMMGECDEAALDAMEDNEFGKLAMKTITQKVFGFFG